MRFLGQGEDSPASSALRFQVRRCLDAASLQCRHVARGVLFEAPGDCITPQGRARAHSCVISHSMSQYTYHGMSSNITSSHLLSYHFASSHTTCYISSSFTETEPHADRSISLLGRIRWGARGLSLDLSGPERFPRGPESFSSSFSHILVYCSHQRIIP